MQMRGLRPLLLALAMGLLVALIGLLLFPGLASAGRPGEGRTARMNIEDAYEFGEISYEQMILFKAYLLYMPEMIPDVFRTEFPEPCGTPIALEVDAAINDLPTAYADRVSDMRARPSCDSFTDTEHFRIHYDTTGTHMVDGWPDTSFLDSVAVALEFAWDQEVDSLGFRRPPSDAADPDGGGGSAHFDVYLQGLAGGLLGYCQATYLNSGPPVANDATAYIVMDKDYLGFGWDQTTIMRQTAIHELCHACQFAHDVYEDTWYMECTSVWAQEQIEDSVNMYRGYLGYFLGYPYLSINEQDGTGMKWYGSCAWNIFLTERFGAAVVPEMWYALEGSAPTLDAIDLELRGLGTSLAEEYAEFAVWNWFTGSRNDGLHYEEGGAWTQVAVQRTVDAYPVIDDTPAVAVRPNNWGCNYIHLNNPGGAEDQLELSYDGPLTSTTANIAGICSQASGGATSELGEIVLNAWGNGNATVEEWDTLSRACLVVMNTSESTDGMIYTYTVDKASPVAGIFYGVENDTDEVTLRWSLADPSSVVSLDLMRATSSDGEFVALNDEPLAPSPCGLYVDADVRPGDRLWYRLVATDHSGETDAVEPGTITVTLGDAPGVSFAPVFPNPARTAATLEFTAPYDGAHATLVIYDASGRVVARLVDRTVGAGRHSCGWDGRTDTGSLAASGQYFVVLTVDREQRTRKLMLIR